MSTFEITCNDEREAYGPYEEISGTARWSIDSHTKELSIQLLWSTHSVAPTSAGIIKKEAVPNPLLSGEHSFHFTAPNGPYSMRGQEFSLIWAIEITVQGSEDFGRKELIISPSGEMITLPKIESDRDVFKFAGITSRPN